MKKVVLAIGLVTAAVLAVACGAKDNTQTSRAIKSAPAGNNLTVSLATPDGVLKHGNTDFTVTFADDAGKPVDVGAIAMTFHMPQMATMAAMTDSAAFTTTDTPGIYRAKATIETAGEWQVKVTYEGPKGTGQASFPVTAQ
ncbi:MAG: FixH family protein [Acidobacteriota bacterium]